MVTAVNTRDVILGASTRVSTDLLSSSEKPGLVRQIDQLLRDQTLLAALATTYGITTELTAFNSAVSTLTSYLATCIYPVLWSNLSTVTFVTRTTLDTNILNVGTTMAALQTKIDSFAARVATLSINNVGLPVDSGNNVTSYATAAGTLSLKIGTTTIAPTSITFTSTSETNVHVVINATTGVITVSALNAAVGSSVLNCLYGGITTSVNFSCSKQAVGTPGVTGNSSKRAYCLSTTATPNTTPPTSTSGPSSLPANGSSGITNATSWTSGTQTPTAGQYLYQSDGVYDTTANTIAWTVPYWSSLKVGSLSAITANLGSITAGNIDIGNASTSWHIDTLGNMWSGNASFGSAPFRVSNGGAVTATALTITGASIEGVSSSTVVSNAATGATALQPSGNLTGSINSTPVATVVSGAAAGGVAIPQAGGVNLSGALGMTGSGVIKVGTNPTLTGTTFGGTGVIIGPGGIAGGVSGVAQFFINASTGAATFSGAITGASIYIAAGKFQVNSSTGEAVLFKPAISCAVGSNVGDPTSITASYSSMSSLDCIRGNNTSTGIGIRGMSTTGKAMYGVASGSGGIGVHGETTNGYGLYGSATSGYGVQAECTTGTALHVQCSGAGTGIYANSAGGNAITCDGILQVAGNITQSAGTLNTLRATNPAANNTYSLGASGTVWSAIYAATGVVNTSDIRTKTDIESSDLGLDFINKLNPVKYKLLVGENTESVVDGKSVLVPRAGERYHYGLIAQDVRKALDTDNISIWSLEDKTDSTSQQALSYTELISPMIKAIQELSKQVEELRNK